MFSLLTALLLGLLAGAPEATDWSAASTTDVVQIITHDEDGAVRETKVWIVVLDGVPYIRTGDTNWNTNIDRDPNVMLRVGETEHSLRAERVTDSALAERIHSTFREKYGFQDRMAGLVTWGERRLMRLVPRPQD